MDKQARLAALGIVSALILSGCGGGDSTAAAPAPTPSPPPPAAVAAATATAENNPMCQAVQPFYWEIGDKTGMLAGASVGSGAPARTDAMSIASASKWLYAGYVVQKVGGVQNLDMSLDVPFLNFTSGYSQYGNSQCTPTGTVQECVDENNSSQDPSTVGYFFYDSGHMEVHAATSRIGLADEDDIGLASTVLTSDTGSYDVPDNVYSQPLLAGGVFTSAGAYANFLVGVLNGSQAMHDVLTDDESAGTYVVPTTSTESSVNARMYSPISDAVNADGRTEAWSYSLGHWVENDPTYGDHALSSAGAFGFYPWIDKTLTWYGILARQAPQDAEQYEGFQSAQCGRLIRQAWVTSTEVTASVPTPSAE